MAEFWRTERACDLSHDARGAAAEATVRLLGVLQAAEGRPYDANSYVTVARQTVELRRIEVAWWDRMGQKPLWEEYQYGR